MKIEIISGSARTGSVTKRVAYHLHRILADAGEANVGIINLQENQLPLVQNVWQHHDDVPVHHQELAARVFQADAFVLVTPEYNGSYAPALKNFLDHFPKQERKAFGIVAASPGDLGGIRAALQLQSMVNGLFGIASPKMLIVPGVDFRFSEDGSLLDAAFGPAIKSFVDEFLWLGNAIMNARHTSHARLVA
jgi:NAD(P)H-dependent FMN reductase